MSGKKPAPPTARSSTGSTGKKRALELSLIEDTAVVLLPGKAYNPYDRDPKNLNKKTKAVAPKPDLRKLSQWIKLKREVDELKKEPPAED